MNQNSLTRLLLSGALLGDVVSEITGEDIGIMRYNDESEPNSIQLGSEYQYAYSTVASFQGIVLGSANVYLNIEDNDGGKLTRGRMKQTLRNIGYRVLSCRFDMQDRKLVRTIAAPVVNSKIVIVEALKLMDIKRVLLFRRQRILPEEYEASGITWITSGVTISNLPALFSKRHKRGVYV